MEAITLKEYKLGIISIETATRNGLRLVPIADSDIDIKTTKDYNKENGPLVVKMLRERSEDVRAIVSDPESTRKALCEAQQALSKDNKSVMVLLDRLDRLEKVYRTVFPDITGCINGEKGCPEDSVVFCTACSGVSHIPGGEVDDA
jgi:hypothetical protein